MENREIKWKDKIASAVKKSWQEDRTQGRTGIPLSEESKKALSEKLMGHEVSMETRLKIAKTGLGRTPWNKGQNVPLLEEEKDKKEEEKEIPPEI